MLIKMEDTGGGGASLKMFYVTDNYNSPIVCSVFVVLSYFLIVHNVKNKT